MKHCRNTDLYKELLTRGCILSEYPPGTPPLPENFPPRNRIISGLTKGTLIVEGAKGSGAMITVGDALDQGRTVFAVPGSIYSPMSATPNQLITEGAVPAISPWSILEYLRWRNRVSARARSSPKRRSFWQNRCASSR